MRGQVMLAASAMAALMALAQPAQAQQGYYASPAYTQAEQSCSDSRNRRTITGAAIGAALGGILGNNVGRHGHQGDGTVLGAVLGGATGAAIGRSTARCDARQAYGYDQPYQGQPYQGPPPRDDSGLYGGPYQPSSYGGRNDPNCRWGQVVTRDPDGYEQRDNVYMCRGRDGVWRAQ